MTNTNPPIIDQLLYGCDSVYTEAELRSRLASGKRLRVKLGMDPTAPDLHLGHTVVLQKLRQFQDAGHKAVLIIGDYTAMIGDPTGKSKTRPMLSPDDVKTNAATYFAQANKVLDMSPDKLEVRYNSEWLSPLTFADVIKLMSQMTVARMLERDTFAKRQAEGKEIYLHELLYPLMQARDSVAIESDIELGGTDQTFNNLCGRDLQRNVGQPPQIVMIMPILVGTDGVNKMSKSLGNYIAVTDSPRDMFGKVMSIPDALLANYFELLTTQPKEWIAEHCGNTGRNPRDTKKELARLLITRFHHAAAAQEELDNWHRVFEQRDAIPQDIPEFQIPAELLKEGKVIPRDLIVACGFAKSGGDAKRLVQQKGVKLNGVAIDDPIALLVVKTGDVLQKSRRDFVKLVT